MANKTKFTFNNKIQKIIKKSLEEGLKDAGEVLKDKAVSNAPKDTGALKKSIKIDEGDIANLKVKIGSELDYASSVEFGTHKKSPQPFMRPAVKESSSKMLKQFKEKI